MKNLLVGNGINIQFDNQNYTTSKIVLRILKNCDRDDFPAHIIVKEPYLLKNYIGQLFLEARLADPNKITANMGHAVKLKLSNPDLVFSDNFHFDELSKIEGELEILGLSPWNDFHIFEAIEKSKVTQCTYYYFSDEQRDKVLEMLPTLHSKGLLQLCPLKNFWSKMYEN